MSISSSFRSEEKLKNDHVKEQHSIFGNTIPTGSARHSIALYFAFSPVFEEQGLVQVVIARPAMGEVPISMPKCELQSLFDYFPFRV